MSNLPHMCHMGLLDPIHGKAARARDMAQEVRDAVGPAWALLRGQASWIEEGPAYDKKAWPHP